MDKKEAKKEMRKMMARVTGIESASVKLIGRLEGAYPLSYMFHETSLSGKPRIVNYFSAA